MYDDGVGTAPGRDPLRGPLGFRGVRVHARRLEISSGVHRPPAGIAREDVDGLWMDCDSR
jgi:hypothetical protein